ncbi:hypothetical protein [Actinomadura sp. 6N118]|uniref:hypothetical protein n=1 Tax=Actinomadura sp. 6N118 TaxID=3375151 RepID=UPI0037BDA4ED
MNDHLRAAMRDARVTRLDDRGLMSLEEARALLARTQTFRRGEGELVDGTFVLELDRVWAALLSLADAAEFTAIATGLTWEADPRGMENLALYERYGDGVLPWIATRVDDKGVLHNKPWCVLPCLLASGSDEAFGIAASLRDQEVLCQWVIRHPDSGFRLLAGRSQEKTVAAAIRALHQIDPRGTAHRLPGLGLDTPPMPDRIRAALDAAPRIESAPSMPLAMAELEECFQDWEYPMWDNANYFCAAMRMTGFITPGGTDGLVFQSLVTGLGQGDIRVEFHRFGFGLPFGWINGTAHQVADEETADTIEQTHSVGGRALDPHPEFGDALGRLEVHMLALDPDEAFLNGEPLKQVLDLPATAVPLFTLDEWTMPEAEESASRTDDLVLAVEALRERRAITSALHPRSRELYLRERVALLGGHGGPW